MQGQHFVLPSISRRPRDARAALPGAQPSARPDNATRGVAASRGCHLGKTSCFVGTETTISRCQRPIHGKSLSPFDDVAVHDDLKLNRDTVARHDPWVMRTCLKPDELVLKQLTKAKINAAARFNSHRVHVFEPFGKPREFCLLSARTCTFGARSLFVSLTRIRIL